jgi:hypothetical protein
VSGFGDLKSKAARTLRAFPKRGHKIVFTHIPKCAGTSVGAAIGHTVHPFSRNILNYRAAYPAGQLLSTREITTSGLRDNAAYLQFLLCYQLNRGFRYVGGHYPVSKLVLETYGERYKFVTILRNPVERWCSQFVFESGLRRQSDTTSMMELEDEFDGIISSNLGLVMGSMMTSFLTSTYPTSPSEAASMVVPAAETLALYAVVGTVDRMDAFQQNFEAATQSRIRIRRKNQSHSLYGKRQQGRLSLIKEFLNRDDTRTGIATLCAADLALFCNTPPAP